MNMDTFFVIIAILAAPIILSVLLYKLGKRFFEEHDIAEDEEVYLPFVISDGMFYWKEDGKFCKTQMEEGQPDFDNAVKIDPMDAPIEEVHMLMKFQEFLET